MRLFTKLGLAPALAVALMAIAASSAAASTEFEASEYPAAVSGEQLASQTLTLEGEVKVSCEHLSLSGELPEPLATVAVTPAYSECTALGSSASVKANGCQYVLKGSEETEANKFKGTTSVSCPPEQSIVVSAQSGKCEAKIGSQSSLSSTTLRSELEAAPADVKVEQSLSGVHYTVAKDEGTCPFSGTGEKTNGSLGNSTLKATFEAEAAGLAIVTAVPTKLCEQAPVNGACPKGKAIKKGAAFGGQLMTGEVVYFFIEEYKAVKNVIICQKTSFSSKTSEDVGNPLNIESVSFTFAACETTIKTKCTDPKVENAPTTGTINASEKLNPGNGIMTMPLAIKFDCGTEIEGCEYQLIANEFWIRGNTPFAKMFVDPKQLGNTAGTKGCFNRMTWYTEYEVTAPAPVWVTG